jgi:hypothetical protein
MLELTPKKKDSYFRIVNIKLSSINNVKEDDRYKFERLFDKRVTSCDNKDRRKEIV